MSGSHEAESRCVSSLTIAHRDDEWNVQILRLRGYRDAYRNIKRGFPIMKTNIVFYIEVLGNCCWEIYAKRKFRGDKQTIFPGESQVLPDFQPVSIKRLECTN